MTKFFKDHWEVVLGAFLGALFGWLLGMDVALTMVDRGVVPCPNYVKENK